MRHLSEGDVGLSLYLGLLFLPFSLLHFTSTPVSTVQDSDSCFPPDTHRKYSKNKREGGTLLISSITIRSSSTFTIWQWIITTLRGLFSPCILRKKVTSHCHSDGHTVPFVSRCFPFQSCTFAGVWCTVVFSSSFLIHYDICVFGLFNILLLGEWWRGIVCGGFHKSWFNFLSKPACAFVLFCFCF